MNKILIIEDDIEINKMLSELFLNNGYEVITSFSGTEALLVLKSSKISIALLDIMIPGLNGFEVIKEIRKNNTFPVIVLTALDSKENKVDMFKNGIDDYIVKPFDVDELLLRVEAVLKRSYNIQDVDTDIYVYKDIALDRASYKVVVNEQEVLMTKIEFTILELLMSNPKRVFTKDNILSNVWGSDYYSEENSLYVHISNIRSKLANVGKEKLYIETVWGIGFKMN